MEKSFGFSLLSNSVNGQTKSSDNMIGMQPDSTASNIRLALGVSPPGHGQNVACLYVNMLLRIFLGNDLMVAAEPAEH